MGPEDQGMAIYGSHSFGRISQPLHSSVFMEKPGSDTNVSLRLCKKLELPWSMKGGWDRKKLTKFYALRNKKKEMVPCISVCEGGQETLRSPFHSWITQKIGQNLTEFRATFFWRGQRFGQNILPQIEMLPYAYGNVQPQRKWSRRPSMIRAEISTFPSKK